MNKSLIFSLLQSASLPAPSSEGADGLHKIASPVFGVRVSGGHLCEAEAPTEAAAERC